MNIVEELFDNFKSKKTLKKESSKGTYAIGQSVSGFHPTSGKDYTLKITDVYVNVSNKKPITMIEYSLKLAGKTSTEEKTVEDFMKTWFGY